MEVFNGFIEIENGLIDILISLVLDHNDSHYRSTVGQMVNYHGTPLENHRVQWFSRQKTTV